MIPPSTPIDLARHLCSVGHIAHLRDLARVASPDAWQRECARGNVTRPIRGVYACAHASRTVLAAARVGGAATCASVLRTHGVWIGFDDRVHIQVPPTWGGPRRYPKGVESTSLHWALPRFPMDSPWLAGPLQSIWQAMHCLPEEHAIAAMESAIALRLATPDQIRMLGSHAPRPLADGVSRLEVDSGSGNETIARLRLQRAGFRVETQSLVPGMGHHDLLVNRVLGIEIDSRSWHGDDRVEIDRERWLRSEGLGRRVLQITPGQIHGSWPHTLEVIRRAVADAEIVERSRYGRVIVRPNDPL